MAKVAAMDPETSAVPAEERYDEAKCRELLGDRFDHTAFTQVAAAEARMPKAMADGCIRASALRNVVNPHHRADAEMETRAAVDGFNQHMRKVGG